MMNLAHKYLKDYNITKKQVPINNISTDFTKTIKLLNNNYTYFNNNKNNFSNKKLFQNVKLYNLIKPNNNKYIKKRNYSYSSMYNNLTGGNFINNNSNNLASSVFNSNLIKYNQRHYNTNSNIKPNKMLIKSKSNSNNGFTKKYPYKNLIIKTGEKNLTNNKKLFSTFGMVNNLSIKNIKNYNKKISNSYKKNNNYKLHITKLTENIPKRNSDIQDKINKYKKQIENYKKEISIKDDTIKKQMDKISELNLVIQNVKKKYKKLDQEYNILKNNYILLKSKSDENEENIKTMAKKELKLMQVLFLMKERGIDINSYLNEVNQISFNGYGQGLLINSLRDNDDDNLKGSDSSGITVYFPDKIKMKNIMETNWGKNIPKLNFGYVPEYSSENNTEKNDQDNIINDENVNFFQNIGKYQHSV